MMMSKQFPEIVKGWVEVFMQRSFSNFKKFMDEEDLSPTQVNTMMRLFHGGESDISRIGELAGITNAGASQMVERLVQTGLVERKESTDDRRVKKLTLTEKGRRLIERGFVARQQWMEELTHRFTAEQLAEIAKSLTMLTDAARELEASEIKPSDISKSS
jgi:DNA-binding MarR family transcriptional regulator